jgi:SAM-dependent methyltransferase
VPKTPRQPNDFRAAEEAGAREPFEDAALYDFEYRRRRADVRFYQRLAEERVGDCPGPILDLACGSGRLTLPLLRAGHTVVGVDRAAPMLARAAGRVARLQATRRRRALLLRSDLRALPTGRSRFTLAICAFHSVQHLVDDADLLACFRAVNRLLVPGGWFAFDLLPPDPIWIHRDPNRRWGRTVFRHPVTGQRLVYSNNHRFDPERRALHIRLYYQPLDGKDRPTGRERVVRLCHRQLSPEEVAALLGKAGLTLAARFGGFDARPMAGSWTSQEPDDEHIYVARKRRERSP